MPNMLISHLKTMLIVAFMWLLVELNPIVAKSIAPSNHRARETKKPHDFWRLGLPVVAADQSNSSSSIVMPTIAAVNNIPEALIQRLVVFKRSVRTPETTSAPLTKTTRKYLHEEMMAAESSSSHTTTLENDDYDQENEEIETGKCQPRPEEVEYDLGACGRVVLPVLSCGGLCPSSEQLLPSLALKRRTCFACKPHRFMTKSYRIKCTDQSIRMLKIRTIAECSCIKHAENELPL